LNIAAGWGTPIWHASTWAATTSCSASARKLYRTPQQDNRLHHSFTLSPEEWEKAVRLFHERGVKVEELIYREHGFFTGRELYFLDPSGNLLEVRDPTWKAGMATPELADIVGRA
jgi:Glyoxalase/Bleomycin resistance protein/Dioxygenase superfamily